MEEKENKEELVKTLNKAWKKLKRYPTYKEFNRLLKTKDPEGMQQLEAKEPRLGISYEGSDMTTLSLIATITDFLVGDRLAAVMSEEDREFRLPLKEQRIVGFIWSGQSGNDD